MASRPAYLDYQATTPLDPRVLEVMMPYLTEKFGNPHSVNHAFGWEAEAGVEVARGQIANLINVEPRDIIFTSGATEANNMAIKGIAFALHPRKSHVITQETEHKCVLESVRALENMGLWVTILPVDHEGLVDPERLAAEITEQTGLVSIMAVNNEIGTIQPLSEIGAVCKARDVVFHCDAVQGVGRIPIDIQGMHIDAMSLSGHKIYGPKGIGALYLRRTKNPVPLLPILNGGGQEGGLRPGTLSPALCAGMGAACEFMLREGPDELLRIEALGKRFWQELSSDLPEAQLNGSLQSRYWGNLNISFSGIKADRLLSRLKTIALSSGSACATDDANASYVLKAIGLEHGRAEASIRIGIGRQTTVEEMSAAREEIISAVTTLRSS